MAIVIAGNKIKKNDGTIVAAQTGGWYDGQQFWNGTLQAKAGVIHSESNQPGAGQAVSKEVNRATSVAAGLAPDANQTFINKVNSQPAPISAPGANGTQPGTIATPTTATTTVSPDLSPIQKSISDVQAAIDKKKAEADKRRSEVNENPFLSESSRVGRIAKIDSMLNDTLLTDQANLTNLNKQLTDKQAEIAAQEKKNAPDYEIKTETDDNGNITVLTIDKKTGNIVNTQKATGGKVTKASGSGGSSGLTATQQKAVTVSARTAIVEADKNVEGKVDKFLSAQEVQSAIDSVMLKSGVDEQTAFDYVVQAMTDLGYQKWNF